MFDTKYNAKEFFKEHHEDDAAVEDLGYDYRDLPYSEMVAEMAKKDEDIRKGLTTHDCDLLHVGNALVGEILELSRILLVSNLFAHDLHGKDAHPITSDAVRNHLLEEAGDVLFFATATANNLSVRTGHHVFAGVFESDDENIRDRVLRNPSLSYLFRILYNRNELTENTLRSIIGEDSHESELVRNGLTSAACHLLSLAERVSDSVKRLVIQRKPWFVDGLPSKEVERLEQCLQDINFVLTILLAAYGFSLEYARLANMRKLIGPGGRFNYIKGYNDADMIARADKANQA